MKVRSIQIIWILLFHVSLSADLKPASAERGKNLEHLRNFISVVYSSLSKEAAIAITKNKVHVVRVFVFLIEALNEFLLF